MQFIVLLLTALFAVLPGLQNFLLELIGGIGSSFIDQIPAGVY